MEVTHIFEMFKSIPIYRGLAFEALRLQTLLYENTHSAAAIDSLGPPISLAT